MRRDHLLRSLVMGMTEERRRNPLNQRLQAETTGRGTRIPSLDGLRAVSIVAVILGHLTGTGGFPRGITPILVNDYVDVAELGVRVFFVISGYLITRLLLGEEERNGRASLPQFYLRRALRILPAYLAYVGVVAGLTAAGLAAVGRIDVLHALTFTINYVHRPPAWPVAHLWSLAVEEQFYLLWPLVLVWGGRRRATTVAVTVLWMVPLIRFATMLDHQAVRTFHTTADALALGCLMALCADRLGASRRWGRLADAWWLAPGLLAASAAAGALQNDVTLLTQDALANFACAALVLFCVRRPHTLAGRALNVRPVMFVGTLSYSLYLWQQLFVDRYGSLSNAFPMNVGLAVAWALISYYGVERPFLALRRRLEARPSGTAPTHELVLQAPGL
jgi:peptidoglycan/LPS O-acetylase OafA/YrhL